MNVKTALKCQNLHRRHPAQWSSNIQPSEREDKRIFSLEGGFKISFKKYEMLLRKNSPSYWLGLYFSVMGSIIFSSVILM